MTNKIFLTLAIISAAVTATTAVASCSCDTAYDSTACDVNGPGRACGQSTQDQCRGGAGQMRYCSWKEPVATTTPAPPAAPEAPAGPPVISGACASALQCVSAAMAGADGSASTMCALLPKSIACFSTECLNDPTSGATMKAQVANYQQSMNAVCSGTTSSPTSTPTSSPTSSGTSSGPTATQAAAAAANLAMMTKICGQMLPGDEAAFVKLARDTFTDLTKMATDADIGKSFVYVAAGGR